MATAIRIDEQWDDAAALDAAFIERELGLAPGARLLDVPCRSGAHSIELAKRGFTTVGIDPSRPAIDAARAAARRARVKARFAVGELRELSAAEPFDAALCLGDAISMVEPREAQLFFNLVAAALVPNGRFVIDTRHCAESLFPLPAGALYDARSSMLKTMTQVTIDGETHPRIDARRVTTSGELVRMLGAAGLRAIGLFADTAGTPFAPGASRLLITAVRAY